MRRFLALYSLLACCLIACGDAAPPAAPATATASAPALPPGTIPGVVSFGGRSESLSLEVVATPELRALGLMNRPVLPDRYGMLFVYPRDTSGGHWMKNTLMPLDIAYADAEGVVFEIVQGKPEDLTVLTASRPFRLVLEVPEGWFATHGLGTGARIAVPSGLPAAQ